eukprot:GHVS01011425.1.p1 GENE.GHVS01011425.1~~GHVS01011425.1.p1  ORF type:complete len:403 (+),score=48.94 GHVS01011425.1:45-1253(+)
MAAKTKHILCTGGAGYIGSHTVVHLLSNGYKVTILDNFINSCMESVNRIRRIANNNNTTTTSNDVGDQLVMVEGDIRDKEQLTKLFKRNTFDAIIHYAGLKAVGESTEKPLEYYDNNVGGTVALLETMLLYSSCRVFVFSSSATVYRPTDKLIDETFPLGASNPYGHTKVFIEQILQDMHISQADMRISILRYFNPVGAHPSGTIGESPEQPQNLLPYITQVAVGRRPHLNVFGDDWDTKDGTGVRDYIHVEDLALGHLAALSNLLQAQDGCCLIHNLGTGKGVSVLELKTLFETACGKPLMHKVIGRRPGDLGCVVADASKAEKELGWKATRTIEEACASSWKWQSTYPYGYCAAPPASDCCVVTNGKLTACCGNTNQVVVAETTTTTCCPKEANKTVAAN